MQRKSLLIKISTLLLACCLLLCGCTPTGITDNSSSSNIELPASSEPIQILSCFNREDADKTKTAPKIIDIGNGQILTFEYNYAGEDDNKITTTTIKQIDIVKDTVCCQNVLKGTLDPFGKCSSENIWLTDISTALPSGKKIYKLDAELNIVKEMTFPTAEGVFSDDYKTFYYLDSSLLVALDVDTKETTYIELPHDLRFFSLSGYDSETKSIYGCVYTCNEETGAIMNVDNKTFSLLNRELVPDTICDSNYYGSTYDKDKQQRFYYEGVLDDENVEFFTPDTTDTYRYDLIEHSNYLMGKRIVGTGTSYYDASKVDTRICRFSDDGMEYCDLNNLGFESYLSNAVYISDRQCLAGSSNIDGVQKIVLINVNLLNYENKMPIESKKMQNLVDSKLWKENEEMFAIPEVSAELKEARAYSDEIEKKYSVTILISNQCSVLSKKQNYTGFEFTTTDKQIMNEPEKDRIMKSLEQLDSALSQYPDNFFEKFRTYSQTGGMRYLLVGNMDSGRIGAVGFAEIFDEWYDAFVDISYAESNVTNTYHHETWHVIEELCKYHDATSFNFEEWSKLNPKDFTYSLESYLNGDIPQDGLCSDAFTYDYYFTDPYAMTDGKEDRARLFEYVMTPYLDTEIVTASPHTSAKFKVMVNAVRECWGDSAWESSQWEDALNNCGQ